MIPRKINPQKIPANPEHPPTPEGVRGPVLRGSPIAPSATDDAFISRGALAQRWSMSPKTIGRMEKAGTLRPILLGKRKRFSMADILRIEREGRSR